MKKIGKLKVKTFTAPKIGEHIVLEISNPLSSDGVLSEIFKVSPNGLDLTLRLTHETAAALAVEIDDILEDLNSDKKEINV